jgi:hypothetical protein
MWPFNKKQRDLEFIDSSKITYPRFPIMMAKDVKPSCYEYQKNKYGKVEFPRCPGMIDYARLGYIVPAWTDIRVMANKAGIMTSVGSAKRGNPGFDNARRMETNIMDGYTSKDPNITPVPLLFGSPWKIFTPHNLSVLIMPAVYHSTFLEDLDVWPGVVDYNKFHTMNFICSPKRECDVTIKAGDPLLHLIPFENKEILAGYGPPSPEQEAIAGNQIPSGDTQYYRKFFMYAKKFLLSEKNT